MTVRIAMWSGPRNISTALMRSWEARGDCGVSDEPLYAHYLQETKLDQNEELAELRADTSIEKQEMANANRLKLAKMKPKGGQ